MKNAVTTGVTASKTHFMSERGRFCVDQKPDRRINQH